MRSLEKEIKVLMQKTHLFVRTAPINSVSVILFIIGKDNLKEVSLLKSINISRAYKNSFFFYYS